MREYYAYIPAHGFVYTFSTPSSEQEGSTLSRGAISGIAVGAVAGLAILCGIGFFLYSRSRRPTRDATAEVQGAATEVIIVDVKPPVYSVEAMGPQELPVEQYGFSTESLYRW